MEPTLSQLNPVHILKPAEHLTDNTSVMPISARWNVSRISAYCLV